MIPGWLLSEHEASFTFLGLVDRCALIVNWLPGGKTGVSVESFTEIRPTEFHFKAFLRLSDKQDRLFFS